MKRLFFAIAVILYFASCNEVPVDINYNNKPVDTTLADSSYIALVSVTPDPKKVLIEDFTGVRCPNCPKAAERIHKIDSMYPGKIVAVGIHVFNSVFTIPHDDGFDFRTEPGTKIFEMLGKGGLPIGNVDRVVYSGETSELIREDKWETYTIQRLSEDVPVNITIEDSIYTEGTEKYLIARVILHFHQDLPDDYYLTVGLTENNIVAKQSMPDHTIKSDYVHKHVFRHLFTFFSGDQLEETIVKNLVFVKEFKVRIDEEYTGWKEENLNIFAFVHKGVTSNEVVQVEEIHLK
jgi:hypothetical protein